MPTYQVWFCLGQAIFHESACRTYPADYEHVADVEANNLEQVFLLTNHIDRPWTDNRQVTVRAKHGLRSCSVGDVVVDPQGQRWVVDDVGFRTF